MNIHILRVVYVLEGPVLYTVDNAWFEVEKDGARYVPCIVGLVKEDIFAVAAFGREVLEVAILIYAVFAAELLPEFAANCGVLLVCVGLEEI